MVFEMEIEDAHVTINAGFREVRDDIRCPTLSHFVLNISNMNLVVLKRDLSFYSVHLTTVFNEFHI